MTTVSEIDELLRAPKQLAGAPQWAEDGNNAVLNVPVLRGGAIPGGLRISVSSPFRLQEQRGDAVLIFERCPIYRLAFNPKGAHANPGKHPVPAELRFETLPQGRSRLYRWEDNRFWPRDPSTILAGRVLDSEPTSLKAAIDMLLSQCHILGSIPEPPWRPELGL